MICTSCNTDYHQYVTLLCCNNCASCWCQICFNYKRRPKDLCPSCGSANVWYRKPPSIEEMRNAVRKYLMKGTSRHIIIDTPIVFGEVVGCEVKDCDTLDCCKVSFKKTSETEALEFGDKITIESRTPSGRLVSWHLKNDKVRVQLPLIGVGGIDDETQ